MTNESQTIDLQVAASDHTNSGYIVRVFIDNGISEKASAFSKWSAALAWLIRQDVTDYRLKVVR